MAVQLWPGQARSLDDVGSWRHYDVIPITNAWCCCYRNVIMKSNPPMTPSYASRLGGWLFFHIHCLSVCMSVGMFVCLPVLFLSVLRANAETTHKCTYTDTDRRTDRQSGHIRAKKALKTLPKLESSDKKDCNACQCKVFETCASCFL